MAKANAVKKKGPVTYRVILVAKHKHLKYIFAPLKGDHKTVSEALKAAGKSVAKDIAVAEKYVKRNNIDGPYVVEIQDSNNKGICHIEFFVKKGPFDWKMTKDDLYKAENWNR